MTRLFLSFDYELIWGVCGHVPEKYVFSNVMHENSAALRLAEMNDDLAVPASWGMVGAAIDPVALVTRIEKCQRIGAPVASLVSVLEGLSEDVRTRLTTVPSRFLQIIGESSKQEAASHSYAHLYVDAVTEAEYREDFKTFVETARARGLPGEMSFIAPKNKVTAEIVGLAREAGFVNVRVNPANWLYAHRECGKLTARLIRILRFADSMLPVNEIFELLKPAQAVEQKDRIEGNFFFRPVFRFRVFDWMHFLRFRLWVIFALRTGRDIHVWTHPHNFGADLARGMKNYRRVIDFMQHLSRSEGLPFLRTSQASA